MKRKDIAFILMILILSIYFFSIYNLTPDIMVSKDGTGLYEEAGPSNSIIEEESIENKIATGTILAAGDIMFHMPQVKAAYDPVTKTYDFRDNFKYVKKHIESVNLSIANFETVTGGNEIGFSGFPNFNSPEETLLAIKDAGFQVLTTANNHCLDQGKKGLINTIYAIEKQGMKNIGTYREPSTPILIEEINEIKLALLSYTYGFNGMEYTITEEEQGYMVNKIDENKIKKDIQNAKALGADMVVIFIHWGNEYEKEPSEEQIELGRNMVKWGANIIFGSHPHVIQKTETINYNGKDNFIIYSMGNFLSNQRKEIMNNKHTEDGIMVKVEFEKDFSKDETIIKNIKYIPTWVRKYKDNNRLKYEIIPIEDFLENESLQVQLRKGEMVRIEESFHETMDKVVQH